MVPKTECKKLADRFASLKAQDGLVDVKFYVNGDEVVTEQACREVNRMYEALDKGESAPLDFKDSYRR